MPAAVLNKSLNQGSFSDVRMLILEQYRNQIRFDSSILKKRVIADMLVLNPETSLMIFTMLSTIFSMSFVIDGDVCSSTHNLNLPIAQLTGGPSNVVSLSFNSTESS